MTKIASSDLSITDEILESVYIVRGLEL